MIPREILKKIRRMKIRRGCFAESSASPFQLFGVAAGVENGKNDNTIGFNNEMDDKRKAADNSSPHVTTDNWKPFRMFLNALKVVFYGAAELLAEIVALIVIPRNGMEEFLLGNTAEDKPAVHLRRFAPSFALTAAQETTSSGLSKWSWRRRSINSASPGVSSRDSTILSHKLRHTSICSASGSARASLSTVFELMPLIYPSDFGVQLKIGRAPFALCS